TCKHDGGQRAITEPAGSANSKTTQPLTAIPVPSGQTATLWLLVSNRSLCADNGEQYSCHWLCPTVLRCENPLATARYNCSADKRHSHFRCHQLCISHCSSLHLSRS